MIKNLKIGSKLYLDYDFTFESVKSGQAAIVPGLVERLQDLDNLTGNTVKTVMIRPSGRGNTHICIEFAGELDILTAYCVRAYLKEDIYRLMLDMARYCRTSDPKECNLIWDTKYKDGIMYHAGEWELWKWWDLK
jgi:hypothetical protein